MKKLEAVIRYIDGINNFLGSWFAYLVIPMTFIVCYEVIARYGLNAPTLWAWDTNVNLAGFLVVFGGAFGHITNSHVSVDVLVERLSARKRAGLHLFTCVFIILPLVILFLTGVGEALYSVSVRERMASLWEPILYPLKIALPIGAFLFLLQEISNIMKDVGILLSRFERREE